MLSFSFLRWHRITQRLQEPSPEQRAKSECKEAAPGVPGASARADPGGKPNDPTKALVLNVQAGTPISVNVITNDLGDGRSKVGNAIRNTRRGGSGALLFRLQRHIS